MVEESKQNKREREEPESWDPKRSRYACQNGGVAGNNEGCSTIAVRNKAHHQRHTANLLEVMDVVEAGLLAKLVPANRFILMLQTCWMSNRRLISELAKGGSEFDIVLRARASGGFEALPGISLAPFTLGNVYLHLESSCAGSAYIAQQLARTTASGWKGPVEFHLEFSGHIGPSSVANHEQCLQLLPLRSWPALQTLELRGDPRDEALEWALLPHVLQGCSSLVALRLQDVRMSVPDCVGTLKSLTGCSSLTELKLNGVLIGDEEEGPEALAEALVQWPELTLLDISRAHLRSAGIVALCQTLPRCLALRTLELDPDDEVPDCVMETLGASLPSSLTRLSLSQADVDPEGAARLASVGLCRVPHLASFEMRTNHMGREGALLIADALRGSSLTRLSLRDSELGREEEDGFDAITAIVGVSAALRELELSENALKADQVRALAEGLRSCAQLRSLELDDCQLGPEGVVLLAGVLGELSHLTTLRLERNELGLLGTQALVEALPQCSRLTGLFLAGNALDDACAELLAGVLPRCSSLTTLNLCENLINHAGAARLLDQLAACGMLQELSLSTFEDHVASLGWAPPPLPRQPPRCDTSAHSWDSRMELEANVEYQGTAPEVGQACWGAEERTGRAKFQWQMEVQGEDGPCEVKCLSALSQYLRAPSVPETS